MSNSAAAKGTSAVLELTPSFGRAGGIRTRGLFVPNEVVCNLSIRVLLQRRRLFHSARDLRQRYSWTRRVPNGLTRSCKVSVDRIVFADISPLPSNRQGG